MDSEEAVIPMRLINEVSKGPLFPAVDVSWAHSLSVLCHKMSARPQGRSDASAVAAFEAVEHTQLVLRDRERHVSQIHHIRTNASKADETG